MDQCRDNACLLRVLSFSLLGDLTPKVLFQVDSLELFLILYESYIIPIVLVDH